MELEVVGSSDAVIRVERIGTTILHDGLSKSGEWYWSAENVGKGNFACSDAVIRVSIICM